MDCRLTLAGLFLLTGCAQPSARLPESGNPTSTEHPYRLEELAQLPNESGWPISDCVFSKDSRFVFYGNTFGVYQFDIEAKCSLRSFPQESAPLAMLDNCLLACQHRDRYVHLIDLRTGQVRGSLDAGDSVEIASLAFSPDGKYLAATGFSLGVLLRPTGMVQVWRTDTLTKVASRSFYEEPLNSVTFTPDGTAVVVGSGLTAWHQHQSAGQMRQLSVPQLKPVGKPVRHPSAVSMVRVSPKGDMVATSDADGTVTLSPITAESVGRRFMMESGSGAVIDFTANGSRLAAASPLRAMLWNVSSGDGIQIAPKCRRSIAFSSDNSLLITGAGKLGEQAVLWHVVDGLARAEN